MDMVSDLEGNISIWMITRPPRFFKKSLLEEPKAHSIIALFNCKWDFFSSSSNAAAMCMTKKTATFVCWWQIVNDCREDKWCLTLLTCWAAKALLALNIYYISRTSRVTVLLLWFLSTFRGSVKWYFDKICGTQTRASKSKDLTWALKSPNPSSFSVVQMRHNLLQIYELGP